MLIPVAMTRDWDAPKPTIHHQVAEVKRELAMRANVFPKLIAAGKLKQAEAELAVQRLEAALSTLEYMRDNREIIIAAVQHAARTA